MLVGFCMFFNFVNYLICGPFVVITWSPIRKVHRPFSFEIKLPSEILLSDPIIEITFSLGWIIMLRNEAKIK